MNIILVEGMDGAGKTTLINKLTTLCPGAKVFHFTMEDVKEEPFAVNRYHTLFEKCVALGTKTLILDRGWYSDYVYGLVMRKAHEITHDAISVIEHMAKGYGDLTAIFVTTTVDTAWKRCKQRGEDYIPDKATLKAICTEFNTMLNGAKNGSVATVYEVRT